MDTKMYLNVPFIEKDKAKRLGAKWDSDVRKWYYEGPVKNLAKLGQWIAAGQEDTLIAFETICIIEGKRTCYRCGKETRVIGFGLWSHAILWDEGDGTYRIEDPDDFPEMEDDITLVWPYREEDVPPLLLKHIKEQYNVKTGYSRLSGESFANHCDHCGAIQGNNYVFDDIDSPISTGTPVEETLIARMKQLKIYNIYTEAALMLDWKYGYCSNDWAYAAYCEHFEDLELPGAKDMWITYQEIYGL